VPQTSTFRTEIPSVLTSTSTNSFTSILEILTTIPSTSCRYVKGEPSCTTTTTTSSSQSSSATQEIALVTYTQQVQEMLYKTENVAPIETSETGQDFGFTLIGLALPALLTSIAAFQWRRPKSKYHERPQKLRVPRSKSESRSATFHPKVGLSETFREKREPSVWGRDVRKSVPWDGSSANADYEGWCPRCHQKIEVGEEITWWNDDSGRVRWIHVKCR
jgi:hypothetical protein